MKSKTTTRSTAKTVSHSAKSRMESNKLPNTESSSGAITAFAPASIGNVAVGFDILGLALDVAGDWVTVERTNKKDIEIASIIGLETTLPTIAKTNTAGAALLAMQEQLQLNFGFRIHIRKGISLGSGMGGSAASAVAAVVAANALLDQPLIKKELLKFAIAGEGAASGSFHPDNVAPSLLGGLKLVISAQQENRIKGATQSHLDDYSIIDLPYDKNHFVVLVHPHIIVETKQARKILKPTVSLTQFVRQSSLIAGFVAACYQKNTDLISLCLRDLVIEPQRAELIPGFYEIQRAAMQSGALGCSISGAGPSLFAWTPSHSTAESVSIAMTSVFEKLKITYDSWIAPINAEGARLIPVPTK